MKQISDELLSDILKIISDSRQNSIPFGQVFNTVQELLKIQNTPNSVEKK